MDDTSGDTAETKTWKTFAVKAVSKRPEVDDKSSDDFQ
jgi:hypothetical protein